MLYKFKILSHLSECDHIRQVISGSAQSLYVLRVLRHYGLTAAGLHAVFCAVVVSRLTCVTRVQRLYYYDRPPMSRCVSAPQ